jgi:hypothetical protein
MRQSSVPIFILILLFSFNLCNIIWLYIHIVNSMKAVITIVLVRHMVASVFPRDPQTWWHKTHQNLKSVIVIIWIVTLCSLETARRFGATCFQCQWRSLPLTCAGFLLRLLFCFKYGGASETSGSLRTAQHYNPETCTFRSHCCGNLKSTVFWGSFS